MKSRVLSISLAVMLALSVGLGVTLIGCEGEGEGEGLEFNIYELESVMVDYGYVQNLTKTLFGLDETPELSEDEDIYYFSEGSLWLDSCKNSGSIWYADESKAYNDDYRTEVLLSTGEADDMAWGFLNEYGLMPEGTDLKFFMVDQTETIKFDLVTNVTESWINHQDVFYGVEDVDGIPVYGPGAKVRVSIGNGTEVVGFHYVWREMGDVVETVPGITEEEAEEILIEKLGEEPLTLEDPILAYYAESEFIEQTFLQPYYIYEGTISIDGVEFDFPTTLIPATSFSPIARIVSPFSGDTFSEGDSINFTAEVFGGMGSLEYTWESNDGQIGTGNPLFASLPALQKNAETLPHTIKLTVEDSIGNQDVALVSIYVTPTTLTVSLPEEIQTLPLASPNDDGNDKEVGIEWVNQGWLHFSDNAARGFSDKLQGDGWTENFDWGNDMAWEEDFKARDFGGADFNQIDTVDFAYFAGHGNPTQIAFEDTTHDWNRFAFEQARWGGDARGTGGEEGDLEWIVLDSCRTLKSGSGDYKVNGVKYYYGDVFDRWDQAFDGLHYVLGFDTSAIGHWARGSKFAKYLLLGRQIKRAWIRATHGTEGFWHKGAWLRAMSSTAQTRYDHLPGHGSVGPDPDPATIMWYRKWRC